MTDVEMRAEIERLRRKLQHKEAECAGLYDKLTRALQTNEVHMQTIAGMDAMLREYVDEPVRTAYGWET